MPRNGRATRSGGGDYFAIEYLSDRNTKKKTYLSFGVHEYWIVDPGNKTLEVYLKNQVNPEVPHLYLADEGEVKSAVLPELSFDLKEIFIP